MQLSVNTLQQNREKVAQSYFEVQTVEVGVWVKMSGGIQVWFCQGPANAEFESRPLIQIPIQEKVTYSYIYTNPTNFAQNLSKITCFL